MRQRSFLRKVGKHAAAGDPQAQYYLSLMYEEGRGISKDMNRASAWCLKAARNGDKQSQYRIARMLEIGNGLAKDERAAWFWLERAAKAGHTLAQYELGLRYMLGAFGVRKSISSARVYFAEAAKKGHADSNYYLGYIHSSGIGVRRDYEKAHAYLCSATQLGSLNAKCALANMLAHGHGCKRDEDRSYTLYQEAATSGHIGAQYGLACLCLRSEKFNDARVWLEICAHNGITAAQAMLAKFLLGGPKQFRDFPKSLMWSLIVLQTEDADSDSLTIANFCRKQLERTMHAKRLRQANEEAAAWIERRSSKPLRKPIDWEAEFRKEIEAHGYKQKRTAE